MIKNKRLVFFIIVIAMLAVITIGCSENLEKEPKSRTEFLLGTIVTVTIYDDVDEDIFDKVFNRIEEIENKMSVKIENSEVSKINTNSGDESVKVSEDTYFVIQKGKYYSELSKGKFDISIGPIVDLWGIGTENPRVPDKEEIEDKKRLVNYENVILDDKNKKVKLIEKGMKIDLGGIAKGFAADEISDILKEENIKHAIINLGGNVKVVGTKPNGQPWNIGIQNPFSNRGDYLGIVKIIDKTVVTSGVYERFFEENGKRYHHIIDSETGYPVENSLVSVSIISESSIDADGLSTTAFSLGLNKGMKLIENLNGIEAIFITQDKKVYVTQGLKEDFKITDTEFQLQE